MSYHQGHGPHGKQHLGDGFEHDEAVLDTLTRYLL